MRALELSGIVCKAELWPRNRHDHPRVRTFERLYRAGGVDALPPIVVTSKCEDGTHILVDGWHRVEAAKRAGLVELPVKVCKLQTDDDIYLVAVRLSCGSTLPLKPEEQRRAAVGILKRRPDLADRDIAAMAGVWPEFVTKQRQNVAYDAEVFVGHAEGRSEEGIVSGLGTAVLQSAERLLMMLGDRAPASVAEKAVCLFGAEADAVLDRLEDLAREARSWVMEMRQAA
jgi:hypothetical protein